MVLPLVSWANIDDQIDFFQKNALCYEETFCGLLQIRKDNSSKTLEVAYQYLEPY
eukprot:m.265847 g.265847  ORF g.265847 m.265847 type:complete len:55 (-) comp16035_c0_seq1:454-618(-)